jgi:hypothetical protein
MKSPISRKTCPESKPLRANNVSGVQVNPGDFPATDVRGGQLKINQKA